MSDFIQFTELPKLRERILQLEVERSQLLKILDRAVADLCDGHCKPDSCGRYDACRGCILFNQAKMVREDS